jgi:DNA-binding GntR family transcriptional regulator
MANADDSGVKPLPAYMVLVESLKQDILDRRANGPKRLPSEAEIVATYGVSRQTARRAYQILVVQGLVTRHQGRGSYAAEPGGLWVYTPNPIDDRTSLAWETTMEVLVPIRRVRDPVLAAALGLHLDEVYRVELRRIKDGFPVLVSTVAIPPDIGRRVFDLGALANQEVLGAGASVVGFVSQVHSQPIVGAQHTIGAAAATPEIALMMNCEPGSPLLRVEQVFFDQAGRAVAAMIAHYNSERHSWRLQLRHVSA